MQGMFLLHLLTCYIIPNLVSWKLQLFSSSSLYPLTKLLFYFVLFYKHQRSDPVLHLPTFLEALFWSGLSCSFIASYSAVSRDCWFRSDTSFHVFADTTITDALLGCQLTFHNHVARKLMMSWVCWLNLRARRPGSGQITKPVLMITSYPLVGPCMYWLRTA